MIDKLKHSFDSVVNSMIARHRSMSQARYDNEHIKFYLGNKSVLSTEEKHAIIEKWGDCIPVNPKIGFKFYRGLKTLFGFNPDFLPSSYFFPYLEGILNPKEWKYQLAHKSLTELIYSRCIRHPKTVLRTIGGAFFNSEFKPLSNSEALEEILKLQNAVLYKPATDSEQGLGIELYSEDKLSGLYSEIKSGILLNKGMDFVLQETVEQSDQTKIFNSSSLNCVRVTTMNLNGNISICSLALKCGPKNSVVDNIGSGKRGVIVGVSESGRINSYGFYGNGERTENHNGIIFKGRIIEDFPKIPQAAIQLHRFVPQCAVIGWDIALDKENEPVLIEGNTVYPGISLEQMCSGPIFGDRTIEVIDYLKFKNRGGKML